MYLNTRRRINIRRGCPKCKKTNEEDPSQLSCASHSSVFEQEIYNAYLEKKHDLQKKALDELVKYLANSKVIKVKGDSEELDIKIHEEVAQKVADKLTTLVEIPRIKKLMVEIFLKMLYDDGFNRITHELTTKIIDEYLQSEHCLRMSTDLVANEVLANEEVRENLFQLLENFLLRQDVREDGVNQEMLQKAEDIFHSVLKQPGVRKYVKDNLHEQLQNAMENEGVINQGINAAANSLK
ncbi:unnamed protein product [Moneuplotes crassus]|uniref:Uncharacterized protein n=1 Tax=Euplotes crassus TaxID=5936 RepID=A0AAD1UIM4_EUPCR|nr:unnamed protein product [Moneuplotes crassus]